MQRRLKDHYHVPALALIAILSFGLNFYAISNIGTGNEYYAACVKSMTQSFSNFFFVSFDPSGMVSVDKPPLGLWAQAISVLIFGYHGWAMLLPQALAGTASCLMVYVLTAKYFGRPAGLIPSLIFALTPVAVVVSRNNTMDMQLIFVLLAATWFLFRAIDSGRWRWLFLAALFVGLGFNIKMLQAYMILPAVAVVYLIFAKEKFGKRLLAGFISIAVVFVVSFAWVAVVELTPAANRPYVDSTSGNSMLELITGHNGTERLFGQGSGGGFGGSARMDGGRIRDDGTRTDDGRTGTDGDTSSAPVLSGAAAQDPDANPGGTPPQINGDDNGNPPQMSGNGDGRRFDGGQGGSRGFDGQDGGMGGGMGSSEIGTASAFRLWNSNLYGQGSWLLLFAILSIFGCFQKTAFRRKETGQGVLLYWALWLVVMAVFFSFAGFYHRYYLSMLAPAIAALSGVGIVTMVRGFRHRSENQRNYIRPTFLLLALLANIGLEVRYLLNYSDLPAWVLPVTLAGAGIGVLSILIFFIRPKRAALLLSAAALTISVLAAPFYWSLTPVLYVPNATMPFAGPELSGNGFSRGFGSSQPDGGQSAASGLEQYLVQNYREGSFLVVSQRSSDVAQFIIDTGLPCYAYGGFLGSDNSLTLEKLKESVSEGKIRYFLLSSQNGGGNSELADYVRENATLIDSSEYNAGASANVQTRSMGGTNGSLYLFQ
jgi:4-amino-4-deoxy-L-arabinose transferase and related glycosyltransferases of PMT family